MINSPERFNSMSELARERSRALEDRSERNCPT